MKFNKVQFEYQRKKLRWSYAAIARKMSVNRKTVSNWEKGITKPSEKKILQLAKILKIPVGKISDLGPKNSTPLDLNNITESWMSLFKLEQKEDAEKKVDYISYSLRDLYKKLNNASIIINAILNSINFPVYIKNKSNNFIMVNKAFLDNISYDTEDLSFTKFKRNDENFFTKDEAKINFTEDMEVMINKTPVLGKEDFIPGTRKKRWGMINKIPISEESGNIVGLIGVFFDITRRKNEEKRRLLMENALNNIPLFVWLKNIETDKFLFVNDHLADFFNIDKSEVYSNTKKWNSIRNSNLLKERMEKLNKCRTFPATLIYKANLGEEKYFRESIFKYKDIYMTGACEDVTDRYRLYELKDNLNKLFDISDEAVVLRQFNEIDNKWQNIYINKAVYKITGLNPDKLKNDSTSWHNILHPFDRQNVLSWLNEETVYPREKEYRIIHFETNNTVWIHHKLYRFKNKIYSIISDITKRKQLENKNLNLLEYNESLVTYLDSTIDGFFIQEIKPEIKMLYVSDGYAELYGRPKEDFYNNPHLWEEFIHPDDKEEILKKSHFYLESYQKNIFKEKYFNYRIINSNGETAKVGCIFNILAKKEEKPVIFGYIRRIDDYNN
ncbi:MAG: PAS domain-containing protein [Victivallales bacterium]|nr:PAS domain-containing protein [Victivallales bacterium]